MTSVNTGVFTRSGLTGVVIIILGLLIQCRKNVFDDVEFISGIWTLEKLTWEQNQVEISIPPEMKGFRQNVEFKSSGIYLKTTTDIWNDTTWTETGFWSVKNHEFSFQPENGEIETGPYLLIDDVLKITLPMKMAIDESGILKTIPVTREYSKQEP